MELLILAGLLVIAAATLLEPKLGVAAPLLLVALGIAISIPPFVPDFEVDPEWVLSGVLPPLLYSAAVAMPATSFRREFRAISGLSVALVVVSSLVLGLFFNALIPDLDFGFALALGAIVRPDRRDRDQDRQALRRRPAGCDGARGREPSERRDRARALALCGRRGGRLDLGRRRRRRFRRGGSRRPGDRLRRRPREPRRPRPRSRPDRQHRDFLRGSVPRRDTGRGARRVGARGGRRRRPRRRPPRAADALGPSTASPTASTGRRSSSCSRARALPRHGAPVLRPARRRPVRRRGRRDRGRARRRSADRRAGGACGLRGAAARRTTSAHQPGRGDEAAIGLDRAAARRPRGARAGPRRSGCRPKGSVTGADRARPDQDSPRRRRHRLLPRPAARARRRHGDRLGGDARGDHGGRRSDSARRHARALAARP